MGKRPTPSMELLGDIGSPVWDRCLSSPSGREPAAQDCDALRFTLSRLGVARVVVGHTPQRRVNSACDGAVWRCDTGMSRWVVGGACEALEISAGGQVRVVRRKEQRLEPLASSPSTQAPVAECDGEGCTDILRDYF